MIGCPSMLQFGGSNDSRIEAKYVRFCIRVISQ